MINLTSTALPAKQSSQQKEACNNSLQIAKSVASNLSITFLLIVLVLVNFPAISSDSSNSGNGKSKRVVYRVRKGDNLNEIARRYHVSVQAIKHINGLYTSTLREGQQLVIPVRAKRPQVGSRTQNNRVQQNGFQVNKASEKSSAPVATFDPVNPHTIVNGTSSGSISIKSGQRAWVEEAPAVKKQVSKTVETRQNHSNKMEKGQMERLNKRPSFTNENLYRPGYMGRVKDARLDLEVRASAQQKDTYELLWNSRKIAVVQDNIKSSYAKKKDGIRYDGSSKVKREHILNFGFEAQVASALAFVSSNEGGVSDLNFYDGHGSFGFIQFTITYGSLEKLLVHIKNKKPGVFKSNFERFGFTLEERVGKSNRTEYKLVVLAPEGYNGSKKVEGKDIVDYLNANKQLFIPFILLGEQTRLEQIESAWEQYYLPALGNKLVIKGVDEKVKASDIFTTTVGITALVDLTVKKGASGARKELEAAINAIMTKNNSTLSEVAEMDELKIIQEIKNVTSDKLVEQRMAKLIQENQSVAVR